jgi:hypothetical protein
VRYSELEIAIHDASLHEAAHRVVDIILSYATLDEDLIDKPLLGDARPQRPFAYRGALRTGLSLSLKEGEPYCLNTPWGVWRCFSSFSRDDECYLWVSIFLELRKRFGLRAIGSDPSKGLVEYALTEIEGNLLPKCGVLDCPEDAIGEIKRVWNQLEYHGDSVE